MQSISNSQLKITLHQSQLLAAAFFTPGMLFEFGFDTFLKSNLCDFTNATNEEALIDNFYAIAGFVSACNLDTTYVTNIPQYNDTIRQILLLFTQLHDFDAYRFVWLVEVIHEHLHLANNTLKQICDEIIQDYVNLEEKRSINKLHKICVISTSPFLHSLPILRESINSIFQGVIEEQRHFVRKYIFGCFATNDWTGLRVNQISEPLRCWRLYLFNLSYRINDKPELPNLLLADFLDDSLSLFVGYYGGVQPTKEKSVNLRIDIFNILELITQFYPNEMSNNTLRRLWYLLYVAAVSGASEKDLENLQFKDSNKSSLPSLGLERSNTEFADYRLALEILGKKFENEKDSFDNMVKFIRRNYYPFYGGERKSKDSSSS